MEVKDIVAWAKAYPIACIAAAGTVVLCLVFYFRLDSLGAARQELDDLKSDVEIIQSNFKEGSDSKEDLEKMERLIELAHSRLIDKTQIAANNGFFYALSEQKTVDIVELTQQTAIEEKADLKPEDFQTMKHFSVIPFKLKLSGMLTDLLDFLYALQQSERFVQVRAFELVVSTRREPGYMEMTVDVHMLGLPAKAKAAGK